jgi:hypothetical protein
LGEAGVVKLLTSTTPKIYDRGKVCIFVGYSLNNACDTFQIWDPEIKQVHLIRDIIWSNKIYFNTTTEWVNMPRNNFTNSNDYDLKNDQLKNENSNNNNDEDEETSKEIETINQNENNITMKS